MKKIIIIGIVLLFLSCSTDEQPTQSTTCNCVKLIEQRVRTYSSNLQLINDTGWKSAGAGQVSSDVKDCSQDGKIVFTNSQSTQTQIIEYRHILKCN